jgi:MFS family permease
VAEVNSRDATVDLPMTGFAIGVVVLCCIINISDGLDFATMVQAAPLLARGWGVKPQVLGMLFAATAVGMGIGGFVISPLADRFGRRPILLLAITLITAALLVSSLATSVSQLMALRIVTGIGVGSLMANLNVLIIEYSSRKWGNLFLSIMHMSFSFGVGASSQIAYWFAVSHGWQVIFLAGGLINLAILLVCFFALPESMQFLAVVQPPRALERINRIRSKMNMVPLETLPAATARPKATMRISDLFVPGIMLPSILFWVASLGYSTIGYFHVSWTPKVLADAGLPVRLALLAGTFTSILSICGNLTMGAFSHRVGPARMTTFYFIGAAITFFAFGMYSSSPYTMLYIAPFMSFFAQGSLSGLMITATRFYPTDIRSTGVGFVAGFGRFGAIAGPLAGGIALGIGGVLPWLYAGLATVAAIAAVCIFTVSRVTRREEA